MKRHWKLLALAAVIVLAAVLIFAPWPKQETPDPGQVSGPAFSTPLRPGYGAANPFR